MSYPGARPDLGVLASRVLEDGQILSVVPRIFGSRLVIGEDWTGYYDGW